MIRLLIVCALFAEATAIASPDGQTAFGLSGCILRAVNNAEVTPEDENAVRLRMPSAEWSCGLRLDPPDGSRSFDFSGARFLAVDVENLSSDRQMRLTMHLSSGGANSAAADHAVANFTKNLSVNTGIPKARPVRASSTPPT